MSLRVFVRNKFLCRAVCQELAGQTAPLRDIVSARDSRRRKLRQTLTDRRRAVESLLEVKRWAAPPPAEPLPENPHTGRIKFRLSRVRQTRRYLAIGR